MNNAVIETNLESKTSYLCLPGRDIEQVCLLTARRRLTDQGYTLIHTNRTFGRSIELWVVDEGARIVDRSDEEFDTMTWWHENG